MLFGTLAESVAEGRGKAQAASLRALQQETTARRSRRRDALAPATCRLRPTVPSTSLRTGDVVVVEAGERIPGDGDVIEGVASVDESAVTGESAPVIRESGGDRSAVTGGTMVLSDQIVVRITSDPGQSFVDRMIALVEGSERQRTPNEIALNVLLTRADRRLRRRLRDAVAGRRLQRRPPVGARAGRAAGLPDPDHDRRAALRDRHRRHGPARTPQRARDVRPRGRGRRRRRRTAPRQDRHHHPRQPAGHRAAPARRRQPRASSPRRRCSSSLADETPEGRSIVDAGPASSTSSATPTPRAATLVEFSATTRMSGLDLRRPDRAQGRGLCGREWVHSTGTPAGDRVTAQLDELVEDVSSSGGTPLVVAEQRGGAGRCSASSTSRTS